MSGRLIDIKEVMARLSVKKSTVYHWVKQGIFPRPVRVGPKASRWEESAVEAHIASRKLARDRATLTVDAEQFEAFNRSQAEKQRKAA